MTEEWTSLLKFVFVSAAVIMTVGWLGLHLFFHAKPTPLDSLAGLTACLGQGRPTLLYFYSNL